MSLYGFGNHHQSEAIPGALPSGQNSPQHCNLSLYAEQLNGSAFTRARHQNLHSWLYRLLPSTVHEDYMPCPQNIFKCYDNLQAPNPHRWEPFPISKDCDFVEGLFHLAGNVHVQAYLYQCTQSMSNRYFSDHDGELLFVPYWGEINLHTEFGVINLCPGLIAVIPRGVKFKVEVLSPSSQGYLCENSGNPLTLPQLGLIGANSLANPRHFKYPKAAFEEGPQDVTLICKHQNHLWQAHSEHSPLNVVAWHGNYAPYSYDLSLFNTMNSVSFDHPDPSIFTVLTSESETPGVANLDFVIFPPRWMVAEHTFRPPYFHRNVMNELMGLIRGEYDAKKEGFLPGGVSIHNQFVAHGPDSQSYEEALSQDLKPQAYLNSLAFMFETKDPWLITEEAMNSSAKQHDYSACWQGLKIKFPGV